MASTYHLQLAKWKKNDEFYTQRETISSELHHYNLEGKTVYCNCDNPLKSNFSLYFRKQFRLGKIKRLISTGYVRDGHGIYYDTKTDKVQELRGSGDFRSCECRDLLDEADFVCTNPPFSLIRDYLKLLLAEQKRFCVLAPIHLCRDRFIVDEFARENLCIGNDCRTKRFFNGIGETFDFSNVVWLTTETQSVKRDPVELTREYNAESYPSYDNFCAINVDRSCMIPKNYPGLMGVPLTFLCKLSFNQFSVHGSTDDVRSPFRTRIYSDSYQYNDGKYRCKGSKVNTLGIIKVENATKKGTCYSDGTNFFVSRFARILIRKKQKNDALGIMVPEAKHSLDLLW